MKDYMRVKVFGENGERGMRNVIEKKRDINYVYDKFY
jgi:hypothetical protein